MSEDKPGFRLLKDNILFLSVPLCTVLGMIKFDDFYKVVGLFLFICVFCVIYKLYTKVINYKKDIVKVGFKSELLSYSGFIITVSFGIFAEIPTLRWLFLIGILLAVIFSDVLSALMSAFSYVIIVTVFTEVTPEFVANSFLIAVILVILTQYFSDFLSVIYSIITVISFEITFYIILHGFKTERLITTSYIADTFVISDCIIGGWILYNFIQKNSQSDRKMKDSNISSNKNLDYKSDEKVRTKDMEEKDYSYLFKDDIEVYKKISENEKFFNEAKRTSKFVKEITKLIEGNVNLAEAGAFYAECGKVVSSNYIKEGLILAKENNFPNEVTDFIKEHNFKLGYPKSRETAITMIVCKLSATIAYLESKKIKRGIIQIIDGVMDSCLMAGKLDACGLSLNEYKFIKDYLLEEARVSYDYFSGK